jgi:hypothetical protein
MLHPPVPLQKWAGEDQTSHIVFIVDDLPLEIIRSRFEAWLQSTNKTNTLQ